MSGAASSWSTQQLTQLLVAVSRLDDEEAVVRQVVEQAAEAMEAEVGALVVGDVVRASTGFGRSGPPTAVLTTATTGEQVHAPGAGACTVLAVPVADVDGGRLLLARTGGGWTQDERGLLRAMAQVLGLSLQALTVLTELQEQQALLERLSRIQRSISARKPLQEVLDAIVAGAAELLGEDVVALRLLDQADPGWLVTAAATGIPDELVAGTRRTSVAEGVGGQAVVEDRLVTAYGYGDRQHHLRGFAADGITAAMAAPVRQGGTPVGSLTIATRRADRVYSPSEQEALAAFAEHTGLALNDAHTVEALHHAVDEATHASLHDSLTGLPNRALFLDRLGRALVRGRRSGAPPFAVLFVDVDDFKKVNDGLGHLVGDRLLTLAGERTCRAVRAPDTVARLGGDEFAVLLEDVGHEDAVATAQRVLEELSRAFELPGGHVVHVSASVGLVSGAGVDGSADELLRDADVAMYHAKAAGKGRVVVFEPGMRHRLQARNELEAELRTALQRDEMVVHYQPLVDLRRGVVVGTEALLRWEHPRRGLVPPSEFVPLAEETGLIVALGSAVLVDACRQTAAWARSGVTGPIGVSVNLSARQLRETDVVRVVADALLASGLPSGRLTLEITESLLVEDGEASVARLEALKALGVRLAVDDFGTGWSSLAYLSRLPVDTLKIDRSFVARINDPGSAGRLAGAIVALADSLELSTVAEGVETPEEAAALQLQGAHVVQGFAYARPVPGPELPATVARVERALAERASSAGLPAQRVAVGS